MARTSSRPFAVLAGLLALAPRAAIAQSPSDRETARALMQEGDQKRASKDLRGALERYQAADALVHVTTTGLEVARTEAELGLLVEAREKVLEVVRIPSKPGDSPVLAEARTSALALSDALEARIPGLRVNVRGAPDTSKLTVQIDGIPIPPATLIAFRKLNPGAHAVSAQYENLQRREDVTLKEGENRELVIDLSSGVNTIPSTVPVSLPESPAHNEATATQDPWKTFTLVGLGFGAAGVVVGSITGVLAFTKSSAAKSIPVNQGGCVNDECGPATDSDINASRAFGTVSTVSFVVAGAGIALGLTSFALSKKSTPKESDVHTGIRVVPWLGVEAGGVSGSF